MRNASTETSVVLSVLCPTVQELEMYKEELLTKPAVLVLNKIDLPDSAALVDDIKNKVINLKGAFTPLNCSNSMFINDSSV